MTNFKSKLNEAWRANSSLLCLGLDPEMSRLPRSLPRSLQGILDFNKNVIDATADLVCAFKPQMAHYSAVHAEKILEQTIHYIHEKYPRLPVILDGKRGDIESTSMKYAEECFDRYQADAATVNPYMGSDALKPFTDRINKGIFVICKTSNPSSGEIQDLDVGGKKLFEVVAEKARDNWNDNDNVMLVVGSTYPLDLKRIRNKVGDMPILVPGVGTQDGSPSDLPRAPQGAGLLVSVSRAILYASEGPNFAQAARQKAMEIKTLIGPP